MKAKKRGFRKGDVVRITSNNNDIYFNTGDLCVLTRFDGGDWEADFKGFGNPMVYKDGVWYVGSRGGKKSIAAPYTFERVKP